MNRKFRLLPPLFAVAALLFLGAALFVTYRPTEPIPLLLRTGADTVSPSPFLLDINSATAPELEALPGIGPVLAGNILAWQAENGPMSGPEDLMAVDGIGEKTCETLEPYITFE